MKAILYLLISIIFISCSTKNKDVTALNQNLYENNQLDDYELFEKTNNLISEGQYDLALGELDKLEVLFPSSQYANKGMLLRAYVNFLLKDYEKTRAIAENYRKYYPGSTDLAYANYIEAMTYYILAKKHEYGQENTHLALSKFQFILNAFPDSKYEIDIITKINFLKNNLAKNNLEVAKFYLKNKNIYGALIYLRENFDNYNSSSVIEESLYFLVFIYDALEEDDTAKYYASILAYNFPESVWYEKSYNLLNDIEIISNKQSWFDKYNPVKLLINDVKDDDYNILIIK